jgi:RNA polymerase sigma-70 factor (ECF subfamily)
MRYDAATANPPPMSQDPSDESLMLSYRDGDLDAFRELYRRHSKGLYLFVAWRSPRREWVDEIVQDSWANLHQARSRYEPQSGFRTFLFQIARNRLIDLLRQHGRMVLASELDGAESDERGAAFDALADATHDGSTPEAALESKQQVAALHAAIRALPDEQREALVLQQFNGMSLEEIATLTVASVETVKSRLRYAMQKLRRQLEHSTMEGEKA